MSHWYKLGIYFGYPKCCIYVPCMKCNQKNHMVLLEYINKNRQHNKRFPNDN